MEDFKLIKRKDDLLDLVEYNGDIYVLYSEKYCSDYNDYFGYIQDINPNKKSYDFPSKLKYNGRDYYIGLDIIKYPYRKLKNLESINVQGKSTYQYHSINGVLYHGLELKLYPQAKKDKYYIVPDKIKAASQCSLIELNPYLKYIIFKNRILIKENNKWKIL